MSKTKIEYFHISLLFKWKIFLCTQYKIWQHINIQFNYKLDFIIFFSHEIKKTIKTVFYTMLNMMSNYIYIYISSFRILGWVIMILKTRLPSYITETFPCSNFHSTNKYWMREKEDSKRVITTKCHSWILKSLPQEVNARTIHNFHALSKFLD